MPLAENKKEHTPNEKQQECIDNIDGKYLVLAGPGTGKTFTLINRVINMLKKGIAPEKILCLTYSDAATNEMKNRLAKELNELDTGVQIFTFHGFCNEIINEYQEDFDIAQDIKIIPETMKNQLLKECIDEINPVEFRTSKNDPYKMLGLIKDGVEEIQKNRLTKEQYLINIEENPDYRPAILELREKIEELKKQGKDIEKTLKAIEDVEKKINRALELWSFYELYKDKMEQYRYIDFYDMIDFVLKKFETQPHFLDKVANKYEYILVDEYQDTNKFQNEIIFKIVEALKSQNVFVVGDDDQIVYAFQGARLDTMEQYLKHFPDTKVICLTENMRSTQNILNFAREIALQDSNRLETNPEFSQYKITKKLDAKNEKLKSKNVDVKCTKFNNQQQERISIVEDIEKLINSPECPVDDDGNKDLSQIAILAKTNSQLAEFAELLKDRNIPFDVKYGKNIYEIKSSIVLIYYLQLLSNPEMYSNNLYKLLLFEPFSINPKDFMKIREKECDSKCFIDSMREIKDFIEQEKIDNFINTFDYLQKYQTSENLRNIIVETGSKTGIFDYFLNCEINRLENIQGIKKIISEAIDFSNSYKKYHLVDFIEYLNVAQDDGVAILTDKPELDCNAIQLSTYHSSKGKEYEYVYMPTMMKNNWESDNSSYKASIPVSKSEYKDSTELAEMKFSDKTKVIYVGATRAKHSLNVSYVLTNYGRSKTPAPSIFIVNTQHLTQQIDKSDYKTEDYIDDSVKSLFKRNYDYKREFNALIDKFLEKKTFSPTAINTYLKCPRLYLYDNILNLPAKYGNIDPMSYGSAVHKTIEDALNTAIEKGQHLTQEEFISLFEKTIKQYSFSSFEQKEIHLERGKKALKEFYPQIANMPISNIVSNEYKLGFDEEDYSFYGIVDRIDKNSDGTYTIIDYKTGNAKTKTMICPDGKKEEYYNQIALYKYFYEKKENVKVKEVCFVFPEEPTKNLYLELTDDEVQQVKNKVDEAILKIKNYEFEPSHNKNACDYCQYKDFCKMEIV